MTLILLTLISLLANAGSNLKVENLSLSGAHGMAVLSQDQILFSDTFNPQGNSEVLVYNRKKNEFDTVGFSGQGLAGISQLPSGYLICDLHGSAVYRTDFKFQTTAEQTWQVENPWIAKADGKGNIYVLTYSGEFLQLLPHGKSKTLISELDAPFDFDFDPKGGFWISEQGVQDGAVSLWQKSSKRKYLRTVTSKWTWKNPEGVLFDGGFLWVVDTESGELVRVTGDGVAKTMLKDLGIPILIRKLDTHFLIYSNNYEGAPALLEIEL